MVKEDINGPSTMERQYYAGNIPNHFQKNFSQISLNTGEFFHPNPAFFSTFSTIYTTSSEDKGFKSLT